MDNELFIQKHQAYFLQTLEKLVSIQSICKNQAQIDQAVDFICQLCKNLFSCQIKIIKTKGSPVILGELNAKANAKKSILFYGHYDVMPAEDVKNWKTDPFKLTLRNGRLYGRGAGDNKGQLLGVIFGLYVYQQLHHGFPCNIKLLIEGEEEKGSLHLQSTVHDLSAAELKEIQTVFVIDGSFNFAGQHVLRLGNRGLLGFEITLTTNKTDAHSGNYGNILANPVLEFYKILSKIYNFAENKVKIPYFYDGIRRVTQDEENILHKLPAVSFKKDNQLDFQNSSDYYKKLMFEPSFNINGIQSGFLGQGIKTIIPGKITARFDCRLVKGQSIKRIEAGLNEQLAAWIKQGTVEIKYLNEIPPYYAGIEDRFIAKIIASIRKVDPQTVIEPIMPGTVPNYVWEQNLKAKVFTIPLANFDQHNHTANENIRLDAYLQGIRIIYELIKLYTD
ncbi:M20/M25/M40 family metallo-hydrolase [Liquorilactobacillus vini]|uniref:Peptidase M20 n=2 Tax=Liquorilactobacillus vini TaxID=238015 RepID=A0A0R2C3B6_9LACO|nr:M20/M25/M40 family metallo-hydrolase [Liquorilactobacillus vini]KRM85802.1 peptidase M20 [Liquorilactobacillus vini DSM 20605]